MSGVSQEISIAIPTEEELEPVVDSTEQLQDLGGEKPMSLFSELQWIPMECKHSNRAKTSQ